MTNMTDEVIECQCNHLTNFAALFVRNRLKVDFYGAILTIQ